MNPHFIFSGIVVKGKQLGRTIGFPTANLLPDTSTSFTLQYGVYAVTVQIKDQIHSGMANVGIRPTLTDKQLTIEIHIFDFSEDLYGEKLTLFFYDYIREEQKFPSLDALKKQIAQDEIIIRKTLSDRVQTDPGAQ
jgi:riboflavin kinase / FMN adenylyltransferase